MSHTDAQRTIGALQLIGGLAELYYGGGSGGGYLVGSSIQNLEGSKQGSYNQGGRGFLGDLLGSVTGHGPSTSGNIGAGIGGLVGGLSGGLSGGGFGGNQGFGGYGIGGGNQIGNILGGKIAPYLTGQSATTPAPQGPVGQAQASAAQPPITPGVTPTPMLAAGGNPQQLAIIRALLSGAT